MRATRKSGFCQQAARTARRKLPAFLLAAVLAVVLAALPAVSVRAQDDGGQDPADEGAAPAKPSALEEALKKAQDQQAEDPDAAAGTPVTPAQPGYLQSLTFEPKAGVRANVSLFTYYADWTTQAKFLQDANATQTLNWSWDEYRKQDKTVENRKGSLTYGFGRQLPLTTSIDGNWNWSEDRTTNTAGYANLYKVDNKLVNLNASNHKFTGLGLLNSVKLTANYTDQASLNQNQRSDFREGTAGGNYQSGWAPAPGVIVVGRVGGTATGGTRLLAGFTSPSSASSDSVGIGVYVNRGLGRGFVQLTRSNFEKKYLEFRRNANGLIDTVGIPDEEKVVKELETKDALTLDLEHAMQLGGIRTLIKASHMTDDQDLAVGVSGLKERSADTGDLTLSYDAGRDSVAVVYGYKWRWDDQRIKDATAKRGRQYQRERDFMTSWYHTLFKDTRLTVQLHEQLTQDIAEKRFNENDKDRLQRDVSGRVERTWPSRFRASMVFSWRQAQDVSIRGGSSANNNVKDSYELAPGYTWYMAPWFTLDQSYRLYIQYTDYLYSYLESVTREDDYNKRGDLTTKVTFIPNERLTVTVRHDFNKRFNATKGTEDAAGRDFYNRNLEQDISRIDLDLVYKAAPGVTLEATTYRTRDDKTQLGRTTTETRTDSGELIVGGRIERFWGLMKEIQVSAMVKKINAYGPSITASSSDYWEADVWLKWLF